MSYQDFLKAKLKINIESGFNIDQSKLNSTLFDFQKLCVQRALKAGKFAIFADCGLGKTFMQLEWANQVSIKTKKPVLIVAPLGVTFQTINEGLKLGLFVKKITSSSEVDKSFKIYITNYEQLGNIKSSDFSGVVIDESSILKNFSGKYKELIISMFSNTPYKLACTATPAPNDPMELGNHSEFLNQMSRSEMLAMFFIHDGGNTSQWRLKKHAVNQFWSYISSFAVMLNTPADMGFDATNYKLPALNMIEHIIEVPKRDNGLLFNESAINATNFNQELRLTLDDRVNKVLEIIKGSDESFIIWVKQNEEGDILNKLIPGSVQVKGSDSPEHKESSLMGFADGKFKVLITKTKIAQFGLNYQNCNNQIFASLDFSFEGLYQAIRRSYRFGQKKPVNIHIVTTDTMTNVINIIKNKELGFMEMQKNMVMDVNDAIKKLGISKNYPDLIEHDKFRFYKGDCVELIKTLDNESVDFSVFSPPFADLYTYSDSINDMGNSKDYNEFLIHFSFLIQDLYRVIKSGRLVAVHCMDLPIQKGKEGYIGIRDFSGMILKAFSDAGFIYHTRVTIWKDPVVEMQRTKALGLLHKQLKKDSSMSRVGIPDYLMVFRKDGENENPIKNDKIPVDLWQKYASPVWYDINYSKTLQYQTAKDNNDEKHICPLQLDTIERAVTLWSNEGDTVLSPFGGIGSEGFQSVKMNRKYIGFELKQSYYNIGCKNLLSAAKNDQLSIFDNI
jgi:DNA modification methylase/superfamily II DNA or RNA helicase